MIEQDDEEIIKKEHILNGYNIFIKPVYYPTTGMKSKSWYCFSSLNYTTLLFMTNNKFESLIGFDKVFICESKKQLIEKVYKLVMMKLACQ